jgi:hypothetical protein
MDPSPPRIGLAELIDAHDWASSDEYGRRAQVHRRDGRVRLLPGPDDPDEERPDDFDGIDWIVLPTRRELDLGNRLAIDFAEARLPDDVIEIRRCFSRRGAWSRFKGLLDRRGLLDDWFEFERARTERALRLWAEARGFVVAR